VDKKWIGALLIINTIWGAYTTMIIMAIVKIFLN